MRGPNDKRDATREPAPRDARAIAIAVQVALERVQASRAAWTRAELMRQVKASGPAEQLGLDLRGSTEMSGPEEPSSSSLP